MPADPISRRDALAAGAAAAAALLLPKTGSAEAPATRRAAAARHDAPSIVVLGAGAFGGWTALSLQRAGARVTLVDAWGAGNARASSGDETRVIRTVYNGDATYTAMAQRAFTLWREAEQRWNRTVLQRTGALYMFAGDDAFVRLSQPVLAAAGIPLDDLSLADAAKRWPQLRFDGLKKVYYEPEAGALLARASCELVREEFVRLGGRWEIASVKPGPVSNGRMSHITTATGTRIDADTFVFACGPWMGQLFPEVIGRGITATRQEVVYFGTPAGDVRFDDPQCPVWVEMTDRLLYGIPGNERRGFKVADDSAGPEVNPTTQTRTLTPSTIDRARRLLARRFPSLANAPVLEGRVCQYERSPIGDFLLDKHPEAGNVWLAGGGSGHGFKMGPAVGELLAKQVLENTAVPEKFSYAAFDRARQSAGLRRGHP